MAGRGTDIMLGGNPEFRAVAELQPAGPRPGRDAGGVRGRLARGARGRGGGRRQPSTRRSPSSAASTCSAPSGTSPAASTTSSAVAPAARVTRARARFYLSLQDDLMRLFNAGDGRPLHDSGGHGGRSPDRVQDGHALDPERPGRGRGAELRDPQERPQVRRRDEPSAPGHLRRAARACSRGRTSTSSCVTSSTTSSAATSTRPRRRASRTTGTSSSCGRALRALYPVSLGDRRGRGRPAGGSRSRPSCSASS